MNKKIKKKTAKKAVADKKSDTELTYAVESMFGFAERTFSENDGFIPMVFFDFTWVRGAAPNGITNNPETITAVLADQGSVDKRREIIQALGSAMATLNLLGVVGDPKSIRIASEGWASPELAMNDKNEPLAPSQDPNRVEVLIAAGDTRESSAMRVRVINRKKVRGGDEVVTLIDDKRFSSMSKTSNDPRIKNETLQLYWTAYDTTRAKMEEDGKYKIFAEEAQANPQKSIQTAIETAMWLAQLP